MDAVSLPDPGGESAHILHAIRHALADPLSAAALKLDLVERRLTSPGGADPDWLLERVRSAQAELAATNRILALLPRLAEIAGEEPRPTDLRDLCRGAGVPLRDAAAPGPSLVMRARASAAAIRSVAAFAAQGGDGSSPTGRTHVDAGRVTLTLEGSRPSAGTSPERLLELPREVGEAEALFVARAALAADGGRLEIADHDGRLAALFSWPVVEGRAHA